MALIIITPVIIAALPRPAVLALMLTCKLIIGLGVLVLQFLMELSMPATA